MLPGTLLYVYIGYAGRAGLETAGGSGDTLKLVYTGLGLVVTVFATFFVTRLARNALRRHTEIESGPADPPSEISKFLERDEP
jgi:uncharacterized membrane protein YdjX (TVP38/TMEM64 family)